MEESTEQMKTFFGVQNSAVTEQIIEDKLLRQALIDASLKTEKMITDKVILIDRKIVSKTEWGLEIHIEMKQFSEKRPIVFKYTYRIDRVIFKNWLDDHKYLLGGPLLMFVTRGMEFTITTDKYYKSFSTICVKYSVDDLDFNRDYRPQIVDNPVVFMVHREIISNNDWIVKCIIPE